MLGKTLRNLVIRRRMWPDASDIRKYFIYPTYQMHPACEAGNKPTTG